MSNSPTPPLKSTTPQKPKTPSFLSTIIPTLLHSALLMTTTDK